MSVATRISPAGRRRSAARTSFTIIELTVAMAIIVVLMALLLPALRAAREQARKAKCASNMRQIGSAFRMYQTDHKGMYPDPWLNNSDNWQSYLCGSIPFDPWVGPNAYLPTNWATYVGAPSFAKRLNGKFLCPNIVKDYGIPQEGIHDQWGYCINATRVEISWQTNAGSGDWPWFKPQHIGADLDTLYPDSSSAAVMTCGNAASWNSDNDWNAFTSVDPSDWTVQIVHGRFVNILFLDGHIDSIDVNGSAGQNEFNSWWYHGIPTTDSNPW